MYADFLYRIRICYGGAYTWTDVVYGVESHVPTFAGIAALLWPCVPPRDQKHSMWHPAEPAVACKLPDHGLYSA